MSWEPKKTAVSALGLPRDVILGDVLISFVGRSQVNVENYRSILFYGDDRLKLLTGEKPKRAADRATKGQVQLIYSLAERLGWSEEPKRLTAFLEKQYGISHPSFLDRRSTNSCIAALKAMAAGGRGERKGGACGQVDG